MNGIINGPVLLTSQSCFQAHFIKAGLLFFGIVLNNLFIPSKLSNFAALLVNDGCLLYKRITYNR